MVFCSGSQPVNRRMLPVRECLLLVVGIACALGQDLCDENAAEAIDGIIPDSENQLFLIKGEDYWKLDGNLTDGFSLSAGYPKKVHTRWIGLHLNGSANLITYDVLSNLTYFAVGWQCWAFNGTLLLPGYPKHLNDDPLFSLTATNDSDDLSLKRLSKMGEEYGMLALFPIDLSYVYFFRGNQFAKYRLPNGPIEPGYPKNVVPFWFQCPASTAEDKSH